jgi:broad specificity phosphatase PhoE
MKIFFIRHGESVANANNIVSSTETPLTSNGEDQAKAIGQDLISRNIKTIICSSLPRSRHTASIIADTLHIAKSDIKVIDDLQERHFGELTDLPRQYETKFYYENDSNYGIESHQVLIDRMSAALAQIKEIIKISDGNIAIVGHSVSGFYLSQIIKGNLKFDDFESFEHMGNCKMIELNIDTV